jgi:hypothetical protein
LRALEAAAAKNDSPGMNFLLGYEYGYLGYPKQAVDELDKTIAAVPQDQAARFLRNQLAEKAGLSTRAIPASSPSNDKET